MKNAAVLWESTKLLVVFPNILATIIKVIVNPFYQAMPEDLWQQTCRVSLDVALIKLRNMALKALQASRCAFITCVRHETSSRMLC